MQTAFHHGHTALGEMPAYELGGLAPSDAVKKVRLPLAIGVLKVPVTGDRETTDRDSSLGVPQLRVSGQAAHQTSSVQHIIFLHSSV